MMRLLAAARVRGPSPAFCAPALLGLVLSGCALEAEWADFGAVEAPAAMNEAFRDESTRTGGGAMKGWNGFAGVFDESSGEVDPNGGDGGAAEAPAAARFMIYTASLSVLVPSPEASVERAIAAVERLGGYLGKQDATTVTLRVPAARFDELLEELSGYGRVDRKTIEALDVTAQYTDLEIRIATAKTSLARLQELLARAEKVEDLLEIEREVRRLTTEIEALEAQRRELANRIAYSTITVMFSSDAPAPRPVRHRTRSPFWWINQVGLEDLIGRDF